MTLSLKTFQILKKLISFSLKISNKKNLNSLYINIEGVQLCLFGTTNFHCWAGLQEQNNIQLSITSFHTVYIY